MRRATIRTEVPRPERVAAALRPDNTTEMRTTVEDGDVVTTIERDSTSGLRSTADDYVVNLRVAVQTAETASEHTDTSEHTDQS